MNEIPLTVERKEVVVDICQDCGGAYFDFLDGTPGLLARTLLKKDNDSTSVAEEPIRGGRCPDCGEAMEEHPDLSCVYRCRICWSVFCTAVALDSLANTCAVIERREPKTFFTKLIEAFLR